MVNFWIVRQAKTYQDEVPGGYLWAPVTNKAGASLTIYSNLKLVKKGDVIFSLVNLEKKGQSFYAVGTCSKEYCEFPNPLTENKDDWITDGWKIEVDFTLLNNKPLVKDHIEKIRPLLPEKYSPLKENGDAHQSGYLHSISNELSELIIELIGTEYTDVVSNDDEVEEGIRGRTDLGTTVRSQLVKSRRGQGQFRQNVLLNEKCCRITAISDTTFLVASHIKPWKDSSDSEKLDGCNGLMLTPNADKLFDRGYISFTNEGAIMISPQTSKETLSALGINSSANVGKFSKGQFPYLDYHRVMVFKK